MVFGHSMTKKIRAATKIIVTAAVLACVSISCGSIRSLRRSYRVQNTALPNHLQTIATSADEIIHVAVSNSTDTSLSSSSRTDDGPPMAKIQTPQGPPASPACQPHFRAALPDGKWSNVTKFRRLYFYHVRKAGGTNLRFYLQKVAAHHGLAFAVSEYSVAEDPGSYNASDSATLYVTNIREPVSRSISHFKYEGRWGCGQLTDNTSFIPTEENARKISTWNQHYGHELSSCNYRKSEGWIFRMSQCAVNCYSQWFAGRSCPWWDPPAHPGPDARPVRREVPMLQQYALARTKLFRYNLVVVTERLGEPAYVAALERFFGVPGASDRRRHPWCEIESHIANARVRLAISNDARTNLTRLNAIDSGLYREMTDCPDGGGGYQFPAFDRRRFEANGTLRLNYTEFVRQSAHYWMKKFQNKTH